MPGGYRQRMLKDAKEWLDEGIISAEQYALIVERYPDCQPLNVTQLVYCLGALLIGLGVILFFAANWNEIPRLVRLGLVYTLIIAAYSAGYHYLFRSEHSHLGTGLVFLGTLFFGAGIWLTGQMFHLLHFTYSGFLYWAIASAVMAHLIASPFVFVAAVIQLLIHGFAAGSHDHNYWYFCLWYGVLVVPFMARRPTLSVLLAGISALTLYTLVLLIKGDFAAPGLILYGLTLLTILQFLPSHVPALAPLVTSFATASGFLGVTIFAFGLLYHRPVEGALLYFALACALLLAVVSVNAIRLRRSVTTLAPFLLFVPYFVLAGLEDFPVDVLSVAGVVVFSIALILAGARQGLPFMVNLGSLYFLLTVLLSYTHFAWGFLPKSLFFIGAGMVLFGVGLVVERNRRNLVRTAKGGISE
ncbi:MAG: DUF2157 domain-containing protein [Clostridia bacterium]|nr:DUF2157 domain-containing protein [Clostridia bacterium]